MKFIALAAVLALAPCPALAQQSPLIEIEGESSAPRVELRPDGRGRLTLPNGQGTLPVQLVEIRPRAEGGLEVIAVRAASAESPRGDERDDGPVYDRESGIGWSWGMGAQADLVQGLSGSLGLAVGWADSRTRAFFSDTLGPGLLLSFEPGLFGGKASLGFGGVSHALTRRGEKIPGLAYFGTMLKVSMLRAWGPSPYAEPGQRYLGGELEVAILGYSGTAGVFRRVEADGSGRRWLFNLGVGVGL